MMNFRLLLLACAACALLAPACIGDQCGLVGCGTGLTIRAEGPGGGGLVGTHEVVLELDGATYVTVCGSPDLGAFECEPVEGPDTFRVDATQASGPIEISVYGGSNGGEGPETVHLTIATEDEVLVDRTDEPTYEVSTPNGEGCDTTCFFATEDIVTEVPAA